MICHTLLLTFSLALVVLVSGQKYAKSIEIQPRLGYSTNVIHTTYPRYNNDLQAESAINVNFQPHQHPALIGHQKIRGGTKFTNTPNNHLFTRTALTNEPSPKSSNLFNVGYNLSFNENSYSPRKKEQRYTQVNNNKKFENAEVITGRLKKNEKVRAPSSISNADLSPKEYVSNAFKKQQSIRHTSSPINTGTKYAIIVPEREQISRYPSQSSTFTYNTQQNIFKDVIKSTRPDPIQLSPDFQTTYETRGRWHNPDNNNNIISARGSKHTNVTPYVQQNFNHDTALKNSESFDFSNAHGEIKFGDSSPEGSEQYNSHAMDDNEPASTNNIIQQATDINNLNIEAHIPNNLRGIKPLPLDTSLLKDPVLTTSFNKEPSKYDRVIPIHFDVRPIQTAMETELSKVQNFVAPQNPYQQAQNYLRYPAPAQANYADHDQSASQTSFSIYMKPEPPGDKDQYKVGFNYGKERANYDEEDIYKIVAMRPPPISQYLSY